MLIFVVPLRSRQISKSWTYVCQLFERCVKSLCNQTASEFRVVAVCHEKPEIYFTHPNFICLTVDYPAPDMADYGAKRRDKMRKVATGLAAAEEFNPSFTMIVDADDCVSKHLAKFVRQHPQANGWFINNGYRYNDGSQRILPVKENFANVCATSIIVRRDLFELPQSLEYDPRHYRSLIRSQINHVKAKENMAEAGLPLEEIPFSGAIYISPANRDSLFYHRSFANKLKENPKMLFSPLKQSLLYTLKSQPLTEAMREEFGLYTLNNIV